MKTLKESQKIWLNDYNERYMNKNTSQSDVRGARSFLTTRTDLPDGSGTLLDVGCGTGAWSIALAEWYKVTGVDNSETAAIKARAAASIMKKKIKFIFDDVENLTGQWDYVFCRSPEFFSGYPADSEVFRHYLDVTVHMAQRTFYLILHTEPPFDRYISTDPTKERTSYMNDPQKIYAEFVKYGRVQMEYSPDDYKLVIKLVVG